MARYPRELLTPPWIHQASVVLPVIWTLLPSNAQVWVRAFTLLPVPIALALVHHFFPNFIGMPTAAQTPVASNAQSLTLDDAQCRA